MTSGGIDWQREKWQSGLGSKFIHQGEKNAVKYADEVIVLSKGVQDYFKETYDRETHFIPNGVNRPQIREAKLITDHFGLEKDSYILFLGRLVPEKGIRYLVEAFKNVKTDKKLVIAGGSSDTDSFMEELKELAKGDDRMITRSVYKNKNGERQEKVITGNLLSYVNLFSRSFTYRKNCYSCPFASEKRVGDLTLGDFWGFHEEYPSYDEKQGLSNGKGVSCILVNTNQGYLEIYGFRNASKRVEEKY